MKWTTEKPTKEGWYWYNDTVTGKSKEIVFIWRSGIGDLHIGFNTESEVYLLSEIYGEWSDQPIPEPEE